MARTITQKITCSRWSRTGNHRAKGKLWRFLVPRGNHSPCVKPTPHGNLENANPARIHQKQLRSTVAFRRLGRRIPVRQRQVQSKPPQVEMGSVGPHDVPWMRMRPAARVMLVICVGRRPVSGNVATVVMGKIAPALVRMRNGPWTETPRQYDARQEQMHRRSQGSSCHGTRDRSGWIAQLGDWLILAAYCIRPRMGVNLDFSPNCLGHCQEPSSRTRRIQRR